MGAAALREQRRFVFCGEEQPRKTTLKIGQYKSKQGLLRGGGQTHKSSVLEPKSFYENCGKAPRAAEAD
jgi:hypothetical protein